MRDKLKAACGLPENGAAVPALIPEHLSLAYDAWAPTGEDGKVPDSIRAAWLKKLADAPVSSCYGQFFGRWKKSFRPPQDTAATFTLTSRLLIGHGLPSAAEVGITLHHTWGVPIIPGSALKGLCAHHVAAAYGPSAPAAEPSQTASGDRERFRYQGAVWDRNRIVSGPGDVYRALFGAPEADSGPLWREQRGEAWAGAARGGVIFHDALYVPGSADNNAPFAGDVLTVHQKSYYGAASRKDSNIPWPNDYGSPNPVSFLTVRPGAKFLLALSAPRYAEGEARQILSLATYFLKEALAERGIGAKTTSGYGRGTVEFWECTTP